MAYSTIVLADSPVGYWRLGESAGVVATDSSGNGLNGVYPVSGVTKGVAALANDPTDVNTAASFDGVVGSYVGVEDTALLDITGAVSLECWVNFNSASFASKNLVGKNDGATNANSAYALATDASSRIRFMTFIGGSFYEAVWTTVPTQGVTYHVVGTRTAAGAMTLYINGTAVATASDGGAALNSVTTDLGIGASGADTINVNAVLDEVAVYSSALSAGRVLTHLLLGQKVSLYDGTTRLGLITPTDYRIRYGSIVTPPPEEIITWAGGRQQQGRIPAFNRYGNREISMMLMVEGTSVNDMLDNLNAFDEMVRESQRYFRSGSTQGAKATLAVQIDPGTPVVQATVVAGHIDPGEWGVVTVTRSYVLFCPVTLTCLPFFEEVEDVTASSNNQANSGVTATLTGVRGVVETPAKITLVTDQALSNPRFYAGRRTRGTVANFVHKMEGETGAFTDYATTDIGDADWTYSTQAAVGTASNDSFARQSTTAGASADRLLRWNISTSSKFTDHYGHFRVYMRAKAQSSMTRAYRMYYGTQATPTKVTADVSLALTTSWQMFDMGVIQWPDIALPGNVTVGNLVLELAYADANTNADIDVDYIRLVPVDEAYITGLCSAALSSGDKIIIDGTSLPPSIYVTDSSDQVRTNITITVNGVFPMIAPNTNKFFLYLDNENGDVLADTIDITFTYRPRYGFLRGT